MKGESIGIPIPAAAAPSNGDPIRVEDFVDMWIQFNTGTATVGGLQVQGSIDGVNFFDVGSAFAAGTSGTLEVSPKKLHRLRLRKTVDFDQPDATLTLGAFNAND